MNTKLALCLIVLVALLALVSANSRCEQLCTYSSGGSDIACTCCTDAPNNNLQSPDPNIDYSTCRERCSNYYCPGYAGKRQANSTASSTSNLSRLEIDADALVDAAHKNMVRRNSTASSRQEDVTVVPLSATDAWNAIAQVFGAEAETTLKAQFPNGCSQSCGANFEVDQQEVRCLCPLNAASQAPSFNHFSFVKKTDGSFQCNTPDLLKVSNPASVRTSSVDNGQAQCEALGCVCGFIIPRKLAVFRRWKDLSQERRNAVINRAWNVRVKLEQVKLKLSQAGLTSEQFRQLRQEAQGLLAQLRSNNF